MGAHLEIVRTRESTTIHHRGHHYVLTETADVRVRMSSTPIITNEPRTDADERLRGADLLHGHGLPESKGRDARHVTCTE